MTILHAMCTPLAPRTENFSPNPFRPQVETIQFSSDLNDARCWFISQGGNEIVQVQPTYFIRNWRKQNDTGEYPRYKVLGPRFEKEWNGFREFLKTQKLSEPSVKECEVTYTNNIYKGEGWNEFSDLRKVTPLWAGNLTDSYLPGPETVSVALSYLDDEKIGRLKVAIKHAIRLEDARQMLQLSLTAKGRPQSSSIEDIMNWMALGHEWIVRSFTELTTPEMHRLWGRRK